MIGSTRTLYNALNTPRKYYNNIYEMGVVYYTGHGPAVRPSKCAYYSVLNGCRSHRWNILFMYATKNDGR